MLVEEGPWNKSDQGFCSPKAAGRPLEEFKDKILAFPILLSQAVQAICLYYKQSCERKKNHTFLRYLCYKHVVRQKWYLFTKRVPQKHIGLLLLLHL